MKFNYMMLSRLKQDCDYFLGYGNRNIKHLHQGNVQDQIMAMRKLYNELPIKPEWITLEDIENYKNKMNKLEIITIKEDSINLNIAQ